MTINKALLFLALSAVLIVGTLSVGQIVFAQEAKGGEIIPGRYIMILEEPEFAELVTQSYQIESIEIYRYVFSGMAITATEDQLSQLREDPRVIAIEPDRVVVAFAQEIPTGIDRIDADLNPLSNIDGIDERVNVDIAILDTGIDTNHPDLNVVEFVNFVVGSSNDDRQGHGSHVAGISAALDNDEGVVGIAPGARLWAVKVLGDNGQGSTSSIISGIDYVTQNADEIEVVNMSLGGEFSSEILDQAISNSVSAGIIYVVAAGNDGRDAASFSPASHPEVITVSAIADSDGKSGAQGPLTSAGSDDSLASFSNFGSVVDIAAPGVDIQSTFRDGGYTNLSGTSMSSPHVAGVAALYVAQESRDLNGDGSIDGNDVSLFRDLLIVNGVPQNDLEGFSGDPDNFAEPLVDAEMVNIEPNIKVSATPSTITLEPNESSEVAITISAISGFAGTVNLDVVTSTTGITANLSNTSVVLDSDITTATTNLIIISIEESGQFTVTINVSSADGMVSSSIILPVTVQAAGGGCLIATATYDSELAPQVQQLRELRDSKLLQTKSGSAFMQSFNEFYYSFSPHIADYERENPLFKEAVKLVITPMISSLSILNHVSMDSEQEVLGFGISLILLNVGMYFAAPVILIIKLTKRNC
ncbi:MAG: S8 family peptidase [Nitrosopumilus sp.]|nr:S8 family peptidase [Nitrosopumilus sp.]MDH3486910.1 S8 family peptidase [Nitrosopumilus sp.]